MNLVRDKLKTLCKLLYKVSKEEYGYDILLGICPYKTLIQLKYFLVGIHNCVSVVGKWILDSNFTSSLPFAKDHLDYCLIMITKQNKILVTKEY